MPVYHFTFHAFGTWLPDRPEGYFKHGKSWQHPDRESAEQYRQNMHEQSVRFGPDHQQALLDELIKARPFQRIELYAVGIDSTHVHAVVAWTDERGAVGIRAQLKSSLTRVLNARFGKRQWFVAKAGQSPVTDDNHLDHLVHAYLPKHTMYWFYQQ